MMRTRRNDFKSGMFVGVLLALAALCLIDFTERNTPPSVAVMALHANR